MYNLNIILYGQCNSNPIIPDIRSVFFSILAMPNRIANSKEYQFLYCILNFYIPYGQICNSDLPFKLNLVSFREPPLSFRFTRRWRYDSWQFLVILDAVLDSSFCFKNYKIFFSYYGLKQRFRELSSNVLPRRRCPNIIFLTSMAFRWYWDDIFVIYLTFD